MSDHHAPRIYRVRHATTYTYESPLDSSLSRAMLRPREAPSQRLQSHQIWISPRPLLTEEHTDLFGNPSFYVEIDEGSDLLEVVKDSVVRVEFDPIDMDGLNTFTLAEVAEAQKSAGIDPVERELYLGPSKHVAFSDRLARFAQEFWPDDRPFGDALVDLYHEIYTDFEYKSGVTTVSTTIEELLDLGKGVCQDFAHLAVGIARMRGIPARYVSGYIETSPAPGTTKLIGSDASHAWVSVMGPDGTWYDVDPTNDHAADSRYIVNAWGRDFADVSPFKGIIFGEPGTSTLSVGVDVVRLGSGDPREAELEAMAQRLTETGSDPTGPTQVEKESGKIDL